MPLYLSANGTGDLFASFGSDFSNNIAVSPGWAVGAWNHVAVTYGGSSVAAYVNGVAAGSATAPVSGQFTNVSGAPIYMGYDVPSSNFGLDGPIDCPAIWDRVLSAGEVASFYANPWQVFLEGPPPPPPTGEPVQPGIEFQFAAAIVATGLTITVQNLTTSAYVTGTTSYNSGTRIASWVASAATPLMRGTKYLVTITGVTATDGTPLPAPITFIFTPGAAGGIRYMPDGLRRMGASRLDHRPGAAATSRPTPPRSSGPARRCATGAPSLHGHSHLR